MRIYRLPLAILAVVLSLSGSATSAERHAEFLAGLRAKGYYDFALFYLDQLQTKKNVPEDVRQVIPYEKAVTLLASVRNLRNPTAQNKQLDQALAFLKQFTTQNPNHPMAGRANTEQARILLGKARVEVWQSRSPSNKGNKAEFQGRARGFIGEARKIFQTAHDQHKAAWESFPKYLDKVKDKGRYQARKKAEVAFIRAQLDLALGTYEEAQSHDVSSAEFKKLLTKASTEFETIHSKYRSQVGGLYARMWQGKCFEEQDDIKKALGIYNELLSHPGRSKTMQNIQNQVRQFRLICLNHEQRKDYVLVVQEAAPWLSQSKSAARTPVGLGIRWELARAREKLAENRTLKDADRVRVLRLALNDVRFINRYPGKYKDISTFKMRELMVKLKGDAKDPEDFDTAFGIGRDMVKKIKGKKDAAETARKQKKPKKEIVKLQEDYDYHLSETGRYLQLALVLVEEGTDPKDVNHARYFLAYVYYLTRKSYEAAILGEFVAKHHEKDTDPQVALDSAYLAMAAYIQAYSTSPKKEKDIDLRLMARVCELITQRWPESDRANDARMQIGRVHNQMKQWIQAAEWYDKVPATAEQYSQAQVSAGQAYWASYLNAATLPDDQKPPRDELTKWQTTAEKHLRAGIDKTQKEVPPTAKAPDELTAAKVSLVQIILSTGAYKEAIALLNNDPHPVVSAISVPKGTKRPETGPLSAEFASLTYQLLLRSYVGTQQLNEARDAMKKLEEIADASGSGEAVTRIYVQLGQELEKELKTLKGLGETERLAEVRKSFENFLNDMFSRKEQSYGSLIWIAETYYGLGTGSEEDESQAGIYFDKAASGYQAILDLAKDKSNEIDESRLIGVKLRLVNCRRRQRQFQKAVDLVADILVEKPKALDAQIEAAYVFQNWGDSGQTDTPKRYVEAIGGGQIGKKKTPYWGWSQIALRLQRIIAAGSKDAKQKYEQKYLDSRYNVSYCRHRFGMAQSSDKKRKEELQKAKYEILAFASISADIGDEWWQKFDTLYRKVQSDLGETPVPLEKPKVVIPAPKQAVAKTARQETKKKKAKEKAVQEEEGSNLALIVFAVLLFGGAGAGFFFMLKNQSKPRRVAYAPAAAPVPPRQRSAKARPRPAQGQGQGQRPKPRPKPGQAGPAQSEKPQPKPKPNPPNPPEAQ